MWKFILLLLVCPFVLKAQISGVVIDAELQIPLEGVVIVTDKEVLTSDFNGAFMSVHPTGSLTASLLAYKPLSITCKPNELQLTLLLEPQAQVLPEVVVGLTPFGSRLSKTTGNSYQVSIKPSDKDGELSSTNLLNTIPGVFVQQGALNTNRLTIRGIGSRTPYTSNRIKAYFGDIPLTSGDGVTILEDLDLSGVGRIEVLKGPSSALYGSGLGGVIKYLPVYESANKAEIRSSIGSFNTYSTSFSGGLKKNASSLGIHFANVNSDGFRQNSNYKRNTLFLNGNYHKKNSHFSFNLIFTDLNSKIPSSLNETDFSQSPQIAASSWLAVKGYESYSKIIAGLSYTSYASKHWYNKVTLFGSGFKQYESRPFNILEDNSITYGLRESMHYASKDFKVALGAELFEENYSYALYNTDLGTKTNKINANNDVRRYGNVFSYLNYKVSPKLIFEAGINLNMLKYSISDGFEDDDQDVTKSFTYKPIVSPRFGVNYSKSEYLSFYGSVGHGFSHPSLEETLLPEGQINTSIKPEQGYNFELGSRVSILNGKLYADLTFYKIYLSNLLVTKRESEALFYGINAGKTEHQGIEFLIQYTLYELTQNTSLIYEGSATISDNYFTDFVDDNMDYSRNVLPGIPLAMLTNRLRFNLVKVLNTEFLWRYVGAQFMNDANTVRAADYSLLDIKSSYIIMNQSNVLITIFGGVKNLFNTNYASMILVNAPSFGSSKPRYYYPGQPLSLYIGLVLNFN